MANQQMSKKLQQAVQHANETNPTSKRSLKPVTSKSDKKL
ncbi:hypothetical protein JOC83_002010 [Bacillus iocasae]|uniref:Uncharacterized protein n=1 Tax=Priestia iocasae TaxID=2291674 RepID=A0ABS2QV63_9BACI|nr:hypothetical protein [Metabacillus iocasae]